jgi:signal transduction histidine kinase
VAHEIRNPLAAIEGFARLLERDLAEQPNLSRLASKVIYGARQLNSVVGNLLTYTRDYPVSTEECRIDELIEEALEFCIPIAVDRKIAVDFEKKSADCRAKVTPIPFKQVITNLVLNAIDACTQRKDGHITIRTQRRGRHVQVVVSDNGGGIPTENKARIFEPFFTQKEGGVGLGLALCQRIIDAHGGEIAECGEEGVGARFEIRLPAETGVNDPKN